MRYRRLGKTGLEVSVLGFGASPLGDVFQKTDPALAARAVHCAVERGINFFDVSPYYGHTLAEQRLGEALAGRRDQILIATKCGRYGPSEFDFSAATVTARFDESLRRLRTSYVDLLQVHDVEFGDVNQILTETLPALRRLQESGKARFIGITGYSLSTLMRIAEAVPVDTVLSYCRYNLLVRDMDTALTPLARSQGLGLINASPLHMGILSPHPVPAWHPAPPEVRAAGERAREICRRAGKSLPEVALRFCLDHDYVATTLVGMGSIEEVEENLQALEHPVDPELVDSITRSAGTAMNYIWASGRGENGD